MPKRVDVNVGIDVGGTFTKLGAVSATGKILAEAELPAEVAKGPAAFVARVCDLLESWKMEKGLNAASVGMGIAGDVDSARGRLRLSPNLAGWENFDFPKAFHKRLRRRVVIDNDANAAVWGGYVLDLKMKPRHVAGVTLGTGVGGGLVLDGRLYRGGTGSAGEVGHTVVAPGGRKCHCGALGCLEAYAGSYGIVGTARELLARRPEDGKLLLALSGGAERLEPRHLTEAADGGDLVARETWATTGQWLALGLANLVFTFNPDVLLILGGVSRAGKWLTDPIERHFAAQPFRTPFANARLKLADNTKAGWRGAAFMARENAA